MHDPRHRRLSCAEGMVKGVREGTCRSCKAPILWATTAKGKRLPLDRNPVKGFRLIEPYTPGRPEEPPEDELPAAEYAGDVYQSHFATCPDADRFRR